MGHCDILQLLLDALESERPPLFCRRRDPSDCLSSAARGGQADAMLLLLEKGIRWNPSARQTALEDAAAAGYLNALCLILEYHTSVPQSTLCRPLRAVLQPRHQSSLLHLVFSFCDAMTFCFWLISTYST